MAEERMAVPEALRKGEEPARGPAAGDRAVGGPGADGSGGGGADRGGALRADATSGARSATAIGRAPWDTRVGTLELQIPKLRQGSYLPGWLEPRRRAEQALVAVVAEAYVQGVSTRKVEARGAGAGDRGDLQERSEPAGGARWTSRWTRFGPGGWMRRTRTCGWMRGTSTCGRAAAWCRWR